MSEHQYYTIKFRLYPNQEQLQLFYKTSGCCRWLYNKCLAYKKKMWEGKGIVSE